MLWRSLALPALAAVRPLLSALAAAAGFSAKLLPGLVAVAWLRRYRPWHVLAGLALVGAPAPPDLASSAFTVTLALLLGMRRTEPAAAATAVVVASLLLAPNVLPWYALWLLPLLVVRDEPAALVFTGPGSLAYLVYPAWQSGGPWEVG